MDTEFELSTDDRFAVCCCARALARSNEYYRKIHPEEARGWMKHLAGEKARAEAKAKPPPKPGSKRSQGTNPTKTWLKHWIKFLSR